AGVVPSRSPVVSNASMALGRRRSSSWRRSASKRFTRISLSSTRCWRCWAEAAGYYFEQHGNQDVHGRNSVARGAGTPPFRATGRGGARPHRVQLPDDQRLQ
ncbi:unnamed protein product, partial [Symbiodinium necroappetens]